MLQGTLPFCSGARLLDRALVVADPSDGRSGRLLVDVDVTVGSVRPVPDSWCTGAMANADTLDVVVDAVPVDTAAEIAEPGWYTERPGFAVGGVGVASVWCGGAEGILDRAVAHLRGASQAGSPAADPHRLAHVGELHALLAAAEALLARRPPRRSMRRRRPITRSPRRRCAQPWSGLPVRWWTGRPASSARLR